MRLDKYLKVSRLIKRRTVANEACSAGRVTVNGKAAKAGTNVKPGDQIRIQFGNREVAVEVLAVMDTVKKDQANELYRQLMETSPQNEETLRQLRSKAIKELGVCFSSKALFQFLCNTCHPRNFMSPYNAEKVEIANKLYAQVLEKAYNIEALENIQRSAKQLLGIKEFRNNEEGGDDVTGYVVLIYFGLSIILILILLAVGV